MTRFDGPQKTGSFGFQPTEGFKFKSAEELAGADKEIVVPLSSDASEAEKAKAKQEKEDAIIAEQYKVDQLKEQARKFGFPDVIVEYIDSSDWKIDARTKTLTIKKGEEEFVYGKNGIKQHTFKNYFGDDIKETYEKTKEGYNKTTIYQKDNNGKYIKRGAEYIDPKNGHKLVRTEMYNGSQVETYNDRYATSVDPSLKNIAWKKYEPKN